MTTNTSTGPRSYGNWSKPKTAGLLGLSAIGTGILLQYYLEPGAVDPELLPRALRRIFGYGPRAGQPNAAEGEAVPETA